MTAPHRRLNAQETFLSSVHNWASPLLAMPDALTFLEIVAGILLLFGGGVVRGRGRALSLLLGIPQIVIGLTVVALAPAPLSCS